jgi:hypothetical protein
MTGGWLIGVMVEVAGGSAPVRHYWAIGHAEQAKAEWTALDDAARIGRVAASPVGGLEPVQAIVAYTPQTMQTLGLNPGELRALGWRWPRRWAPAGFP